MFAAVGVAVDRQGYNPRWRKLGQVARFDPGLDTHFTAGLQGIDDLGLNFLLSS